MIANKGTLMCMYVQKHFLAHDPSSYWFGWHIVNAAPVSLRPFWLICHL